jgi:hypothetical protein
LEKGNNQKTDTNSNNKETVEKQGVGALVKRISWHGDYGLARAFAVKPSRRKTA